MENYNRFDSKLIAPCGVNCATCMAYLRAKNKCNGCNGTDENKPYHCTKCKIKFCDKRLDNGYEYCYQCDSKCQRLKQLDKRYAKNYDIHLLDNLEEIKNNGIDKFVEKEILKWTCSDCGGTICQHTKKCSECVK
jgi:hypothetical protein